MKRKDLKVGTVYSLKRSYYSNPGGVILLDDFGYDRVVENYQYVYYMNLKNGGRWIRVQKLGTKAPGAPLTEAEVSVLGTSPEYIQTKQVVGLWQDELTARAAAQLEQDKERAISAERERVFEKKKAALYTQLSWLGLDQTKFAAYQRGDDATVQVPMSLLVQLVSSVITQEPIVPVPVPQPDEPDSNESALD